MFSALSSHIQGQRERVIALQRDLVAIPALGPANGGQGEQDKAAYLISVLKGLGIDRIEEVPAPDNDVACGFRPNVAGVVPGLDDSKTLWIISHTDIVPPGDPALWKSDPYSLSVQGDLLYGRGVEDNHQGIVSSLLVAEALQASGGQAPVNLGLLFVADEETANAKGLEFVLRERPDLFGPDDLIIVPDFGSADGDMVEVAEKSILWLKITVHGKQCHASTPHKGKNTLTASADLIMRLRGLYQRFSDHDPLFVPPMSTFEATKKEANVPNINTIPGLDVFYLDCRVLSHYELHDVHEELNNRADQVTLDHGVSIEWETVQEVRSAQATPVDSPIVQRMLAAIRELRGIIPRPQGIGGGTVASLLRKKGHPVVVWATLLGSAHQPNEYSSIRNTLADAQVMAHVLCNPDL